MKCQVNTGIQTDGHMKSSTCFWHCISTLSVGFRVEKITGEFSLVGLQGNYKQVEIEFYQIFISEMCSNGEVSVSSGMSLSYIVHS